MSFVSESGEIVWSFWPLRILVGAGLQARGGEWATVAALAAADGPSERITGEDEQSFCADVESITSGIASRWTSRLEEEVSWSWGFGWQYELCVGVAEECVAVVGRGTTGVWSIVTTETLESRFFSTTDSSSSSDTRFTLSVEVMMVDFRRAPMVGLVGVKVFGLNLSGSSSEPPVRSTTIALFIVLAFVRDLQNVGGRLCSWDAVLENCLPHYECR